MNEHALNFMVYYLRYDILLPVFVEIIILLFSKTKTLWWHLHRSEFAGLQNNNSSVLF